MRSEPATRVGATMRIAPAWLIVIAMGACGDGGNDEWRGTMTDSAGITIVSNPADADWQIVSRPEVTEELMIGALDGAPAYQFGQIAAIDVGEDGRIYVLDQQAAEVRVFDAEGAYERSIGKPGAGPGELSAATVALMLGAADTVYVADMMKQRLHRYAPDGSEAGGVGVPIASGVPVAWAITPDRRFATQVRPLNLPGAGQGTAAAAPGPQRDLILLRDTRGEIVDTMLTLESGQSVDFSGGTARMRLFEPEPVWALLTDGRIVHGRNDSYRLELLRKDGTLERVITRPFQREPVTEADRAAFIDLFRSAMEGQAPPQLVEQFIQTIQFADNYPAYARIMGGPFNTIWVQHVRTADRVEREGGTFDAQDVGAPEWDVFDDEGRMLGTLTMPTQFQPLRVIGPYLYGVQRDDLDVQYVVRLRVGDEIGMSGLERGADARR
jgi:hypothetical protein